MLRPGWCVLTAGTLLCSTAALLDCGAKGLRWGTVCAVVSIDISSARLVPGAGEGGWLCRLPSAVVWAPGHGDEAEELVRTCLSAGSAAELLGRVGSHLADPQGAAWPPFAIVAARGADVVAVVHGPVALQVRHGSGDERLFGGEEVGSWLNRVLRNVSVVSAGTPGVRDALSDMRQGVVRASGFALLPVGARGAEAVLPAAAAPAASSLSPSPAPARQGSPGASSVVPQHRFVDDDLAAGFGAAGFGAADFSDDEFAAESPTVVEQPAVVGDATLAETVGRGGLGRLTWDNGEVDDLDGPALVGRDVSTDEAVLAGRMAGLVPGGQNDSMSRVHAEISLRGAEVVVVDRGSTNGTFIWDEAAKAWQRLAAGQAHAVTPGTVLAFGERTATFEGHAAPVG